MNHNPKTDHLQKWQPGQPSPNPKGRKPKFITTFKKAGYSQSEVNDVILEMLSMEPAELSQVTEHEGATVLEITIAQALLNGAKKGSLYAIESLLNRAVGLPKVTQDITLESREVIITLDLGEPQILQN